MADVEVRESTIQGLGVFAARDFATGERVRRVNIVREVTEYAPIRAELGERSEHVGNRHAARVVLWGFPDRHVNHSCDPNAYEVYEGDAIYIVARRPIATGDEITFNYLVNNSGGGSWPCNCGSEHCFGDTAADGFFGLPDAQQIEYLPLLADWFVTRHRDRIEALHQRAGH